MSVPEQAAVVEESLKEDADASGLSVIELESSWWGNQKVGEWVERVFAHIDHETEDAIHASHVHLRDSAHKMSSLEHAVAEDVWFPKSKVSVLAEPDWEVYSPEGDAEGEVSIAQVVPSRYGMKAALLGDTYSAMKEDGVDDELTFHADGDEPDAHHTFNGDVWECDLDAVDMVVAELVSAGYEVKVAPHML